MIKEKYEKKYFHFLFLITGIAAAVLIAQSVSNDSNVLSAYVSGDKKYNDDYEEKKNYDK